MAAPVRSNEARCAAAGGCRASVDCMRAAAHADGANANGRGCEPSELTLPPATTELNCRVVSCFMLFGNGFRSARREETAGSVGGIIVQISLLSALVYARNQLLELAKDPEQKTFRTHDSPATGGANTIHWQPVCVVQL